MLILIVVLVLTIVLVIAAFKKSDTCGIVTLLCSVLLTPLIGVIVYACMEDKRIPKANYKCKHCGYLSNEFTKFCPNCGGC